MAQNLVVNFIGNNKLSKTTTVVGNDLKKLTKVAETTGRTMSKALGAVGAGIGLAVLANGLKNATKAAVEDRKSQGLLALALRNTVGATDGAIAGAERFIKSTQLSTAVLDDELRPALATAVRATGSLAGGQKLLNTALDVSAATGKDLGTVTNAISKAFNGNSGSLKKLLPNIKDGVDIMEQLDGAFAGAAEQAAIDNPYKAMEVIFANMQETIGEGLLPALQEFIVYLKSPQGAANLKQITALFVQIAQGIGSVISFVVQNITVIKALAFAILTVKLGIGAMTVAMRIYDMVTKIAKISTVALKAALITTGIGALAVLVGTLASAWMEADAAAQGYNDSAEEAFNPNQVSFKNIVRGFIDPITGNLNSELRRALSDPRVTQEMKDFLSKNFRGEDVTIDFGLNAIFSGGTKVFQGTAPEVIQEAKDLAAKVRDALNSEITKMKSTAEKFRDTVGIAFGTFGKDENTVFNIDAVLSKMRRVMAAAKGFGANLEKLTAKKVPQFVIDQLVAMGPAQGNIVAKGLLASPTKLSEFVGYSKTLYNIGATAQAQAAVTSTASYEININKAVISAADIIREIRIYEKKMGKKYLVTG